MITLQEDAFYSSGSGTSIITFTYVIQPDVLTTHLDYDGVGSLPDTVLGGIRSVDDGQSTIHTLPITGNYRKDSLGELKRINVPIANFFTSEWDTTKVTTGSSADNQITLPLVRSGTYDFTVYWGDGTSSDITEWDSAEKTHTYDSPGNKVVNIVGDLEGFSFNNEGDRAKLIKIGQWPDFKIGNEGGYFWGAVNLEKIPSDINVLEATTDFSNMFRDAAKFNNDISHWNTSNITNMNGMFKNARIFNSNLNEWDTSSVAGMNSMFEDASSFDQPIKDWNTGRVTDMTNMFKGAAKFNRPIPSWDVHNVRNMERMFEGASSFNQNINGWNVGRVEDMNRMFEGATSFNSPLTFWDVRSVKNMSRIFYKATSFNSDLQFWEVNKVQDMNSMFREARSFNSQMKFWDVQNVKNMSNMFNNARAFTRDISLWNVQNVTDMSSMFESAHGFDSELGDWNVSSVTDMSSAFKNTNYNKNIKSWDVRNVKDMSSMFERHYSTGLDLSGWDVKSVTSMSSMFKDAIFGIEISGWDVQNVIDMSSMFEDSYAISDGSNGDNITEWDVINVENMDSMFKGATLFNQDLSKWRVCENFVQEPVNFAYGASQLSSDYKPKWDSPCVLSVSSPDPDGVYEQGDRVRLNVEFNIPVDVEGTPKMSLDFLSSDKDASYASGTGTKTITFEYEVAQDDIALELVYLDHNSLSLGEDGVLLSRYLRVPAVLTLPDRQVLEDSKDIILVGNGASLSKWDTTQLSAGSSNGTSITLPLVENGTYNFTIHWGDNTQSNITKWNSTNATHNYGEGNEGVKILRILGTLQGFSFNNTGDKKKLVSVLSWGDLKLGNTTSAYFSGAENLNRLPLSHEGFVNVTNLSNAFKNTRSFDWPMKDFDTSKVTDMSMMFENSVFNQEIEEWDVSRVTNMRGVFENSVFDQEIEGWNVISVTDMSSMFENSVFDQPIENWNVHNVKNMSRMFKDSSFDQHLEGWSVFHLDDMREMFRDSNFNHDLSFWRVCNIEHWKDFDRGVLGWRPTYKPKFGHPCILEVSSTNANVAHAKGQPINVVFTFDKDVRVIGRPFIDLVFDNGIKQAFYNEGSDTENITFTYVIKDGDVVSRLNYTNDSAMNLNEGSINALSDGKPSVLTLPVGVDSLGFRNNISVSANVFVSNWDTSKTSSGSSNSNEITLPLVSDGRYNFVVHWGDGNSSIITSSDSASKTHQYDEEGVKKLRILGVIEGFAFKGMGDGSKLLNITQQGPLRLGNGGGYFNGAENLQEIPSELNLKGVTNLNNAFTNAKKFNANISYWDVSKIVDMNNTFTNASVFNQPLDKWDLSKVKSASGMFLGAKMFNQPLNAWNVGTITNMKGMFENATSFQPVS